MNDLKQKENQEIMTKSIERKRKKEKEEKEERKRKQKESK
jgi:hypothetical protein